MRLPDASAVTVSQPDSKVPSPLTMLPSGRVTGMSMTANGANPLPVIVTVSSGA